MFKNMYEYRLIKMYKRIIKHLSDRVKTLEKAVDELTKINKELRRDVGVEYDRGELREDVP